MWRSSYFLHRTSQITGELRKPSQRKKKLDYIWILSKKGKGRGFNRLLHPQHLDGIWLGLTLYRLLDTLSEYPEPQS